MGRNWIESFLRKGVILTAGQQSESFTSRKYRDNRDERGIAKISEHF